MMVLLTQTLGIAAAIQQANDAAPGWWQLDELPADHPSLDIPSEGHPVHHQQIIQLLRLQRRLRIQGQQESTANQSSSNINSHSLDELLRGSAVYIKPSKPKPEPSQEYKTLMSRLRQQEEARAYNNLLSPSTANPAMGPSIANAFADTDELEEDEMTYADVNRQMALIINVLISIIACSVAIWIASRGWSTPRRLGLSLCGSGAVGVAEVVIYAGYVRRLKDAKVLEKSKVETKKVMKTWVISGRGKMGHISESFEGTPVPDRMLHSQTPGQTIRRRLQPSN